MGKPTGFMEFERLEEGSRLMWAHNRHLRDLYYRWRRDGAPDPDPIPEEE